MKTIKRSYEMRRKQIINQMKRLDETQEFDER
jgi:hypothetical protein